MLGLPFRPLSLMPPFSSPSPILPPSMFPEPPRIHFSCYLAVRATGKQIPRFLHWRMAYSPTRALFMVRDGPQVGTPSPHT